MLKILEKHKCSGCYACQTACPVNCIEMTSDKEGFYYPLIDATKCINCGKCEKICPIISKKESKDSNLSLAYAVKNKDEEIRKTSSSGGVFTSIAKWIINKGGVVFGASFDKDFSVVHSFAENEEDLVKFRGSKYVQSRIGDSFLRVKEFLDSDRWVLFSGTPCQVEGLLSYLNKPYEKLITQDLICHGVPSPLVWAKYLDVMSKDDCVNISFRNKDCGWHDFSMGIDYANNKSYRKTLKEDLFLKVFLRNLSIRPSCYNCSFKKINRLSDFTIADYWGIENVHPEFDDDKGASLVILNSDKSKHIFQEIKEGVDYLLTEKEVAIKYNPSMIKSASYNPKRDAFMSEVVDNSFVRVAKKYTNAPFKIRSINKLKRIIKKLIGRR